MQIRDYSGFIKDKRNFIARLQEHVAISAFDDFLLWKCMLHVKVLKHLLQPENDREEVNDVGAKESERANTLKAKALNQVPKPKIVG